ncbi:GNAT family N-acetyltransferase [Streptomyces sp. P3]|uniref:GNAT family N-acetyltransferase n=1 Tax=Streptomyces sp. P3 TaxID=2135430 RepID=UPI000D1BD0EF|nr:GNAT family N-acetyltransferase [Streptomyces sp. P3]AVV42848.1 GNAT family N-acetyltransferase [Streptomyces sp. P3]
MTTPTPGPTPTRTPAPAPAPTPWTIAPVPFDSPDAVALWRAYYTEVSDRYYLLHEGRRTGLEELDREIAARSGAELSPPTGRLLVGRYEGEPAGTAGVRMLDASTAELTRVFVREGVRGRGGAPLLVRAAEDAARALGANRMVLDTRGDLVEARALYARLGYAETEPYNANLYADHWFEKSLSPQLS